MFAKHGDRVVRCRTLRRHVFGFEPRKQRRVMADAGFAAPRQEQTGHPVSSVGTHDPPNAVVKCPGVGNLNAVRIAQVTGEVRLVPRAKDGPHVFAKCVQRRTPGTTNAFRRFGTSTATAHKQDEANAVPCHAGRRRYGHFTDRDPVPVLARRGRPRNRREQSVELNGGMGLRHPSGYRSHRSRRAHRLLFRSNTRSRC